VIVRTQVSGFLICLSIFAAMGTRALGSSTDACQDLVTAFLTHPSEDTLSGLSSAHDTVCWAVFASSDSSLSKLDQWVARGNSSAAKYLSTHLRRLDGGNLEDALVALGQFSEQDMVRLLLFAKSGLLSKQELSDALTMLPLSSSDHPRAQLKLLTKRRNNVARITRKDLTEQKAQALKAIDEFAAEIRSKNAGLEH
jgi:hypothetical protein